MAVNTGFANALLVFNVMCLLMAALTVCTASQLEVGDAQGWTIGPNYSTWAANKKLYPGDTLLFKYANGAHDVLQVTKSDYDSCKADSPQASYKSGNDIVSLSKPGSYYYLCGFPGHCDAGQKVAVVVSAVATPLSAPSSSPLASAPTKSKSAPAPAPKKSKSAPSPSPADKSSSSPSPAKKSAGPSPSKSLSTVTAPPPSSKNSAPTLSAGSASLAVMCAFSVLFFSL